MKKLIACLLFVMEILHPVTAQNKFYNFSLILGMSPKQTPVQSPLIMNRQDPVNEFLFNLDQVEKNYTIGLRTNIRFSQPFFGTLGLEYNRQLQHYSMLFTHMKPEASHELMVSNDKITLPVGVGVRLHKIEITSGLQMSYNIHSEMKQDLPMGIEMKDPRIEMGWYTGVGMALGRTSFGVRYQSSMNRYGDNLVMHQKPMGLASVPGNVRFTVAFSF
ncbi:MAG: hypothetical protein ABJB16_04115 [Saprospiraceae bacterium]